MFGINEPAPVFVSGAGQIKPIVISVRECLGIPYWAGDQLAESIHQLISEAMGDDA